MKLSRSVSMLLALLLCAGSANAGELMRPEQDAATTRGNLLRSALLPGLGQLEQGRIGRGVAWAGGAVLLGVTAFIARGEYHSASVDFNNAEGSYYRALADWDLEAAERFLADRNAAQPLADDRYTTMILFEVGLASLWVGNLVDVWLFEKRDGKTGETYGLLPGNLAPVLRTDAVGVSWSLNF